MPNHVTNIITAAPEVIRALLREPTKEERDAAYEPTDLVVDFALLVPTPDDYITAGCSHQHNLSGMFGDTGPDPFPHCWYVWNIQNWGTKWNGYSVSWDALEGDMCSLTFDTAWSHPQPVVAALSLKFPDEVIEVQYADEDLGSNVGEYTIQNGEYSNIRQPEYGDESCEMAAQIKYGRSYAALQEEWAE